MAGSAVLWAFWTSVVARFLVWIPLQFLGLLSHALLIFCPAFAILAFGVASLLSLNQFSTDRSCASGPCARVLAWAWLLTVALLAVVLFSLHQHIRFLEEVSGTSSQ